VCLLKRGKIVVDYCPLRLLQHATNVLATAESQRVTPSYTTDLLINFWPLDLI
jgi:hypothetical protein